MLTLLTGFFVAAEFSLVNLDRVGSRGAHARTARRASGTIIGALKITSTHLSSAQLGITMTTLLAGYTFEPALSAFLAVPLAALHVPPGPRSCRSPRCSACSARPSSA